MSVCPFCGGSQLPLYPIVVARQPRELLRCTQCLSCTPNFLVSERDLLALYDEEYFSNADWEIAKSRSLAADYLKKATIHKLLSGSRRILEVGGSYGFFADAVQRATTASPDLLEISSGCRKFVRDNFPSLRIVGRTLDDIPAEPVYERVFSFHVLEHLQSLAPFLSALSCRMRPGGLAFFLTPNAASQGFMRFGRNWGWSCPDQHCEFLSPLIPANYFRALGFDLVESRSARPARIHTPSVALIRAQQLAAQSAAKRVEPLSLASLPAKLSGHAADFIQSRLQQNDPRATLLGLERFFHRFRASWQHDELSLLLKRRAA